jgi:hypothetical protein
MRRSSRLGRRRRLCLLLAPIKRLAIILSVPVLATGLGGCSAIVADLVMLPFRVAGEAIEYATEDDDGSDGSDEPGEARITGYCHDPSQGMAYPLYSPSSDAGECPPGVQSISKAEYDAFVATQAQAYCAKATSGWLYRASAETCASGDETFTKSDYEARARVFPMRAAL